METRAGATSRKLDTTVENKQGRSPPILEANSCGWTCADRGKEGDRLEAIVIILIIIIKMSTMPNSILNYFKIGFP